MKKPTIAQLEQQIEELKSANQELHDALHNPPQRALTLTERILNEIGEHEDSITHIDHDLIEVRATVERLDKQRGFHSTQVYNLKKSLSNL